MGSYPTQYPDSGLYDTNVAPFRLLTTGATVDEAAFLFHSLENACHSQLLAEAAAANGLQKTYVSDEAARFTAQSAQNSVN